MYDAIDVSFRELVHPQALPTAPSPGEWSAYQEGDCHVTFRVRVASKQPDYIGFGYVLHIPGFLLNKVPSQLLRELGAHGMRMEKKQPVFLQVNDIYFRVTFHRGDAETAVKAYQLFASFSKHVYKNWK